MRFALDAKEEEEWEGRIWGEQPWDPKEYPDSTYKRLRLLWYVKSQEGEHTWLMDNDQTDTEVSPWEAQSSESHGHWIKKNLELAKFSGPLRLDRRTLRKLVPQPESEQVCPAGIDAQPSPSEELVKRVLKKISSIEATAPLWNPVDQSEEDYYKYVKNPISYAVLRALHTHRALCVASSCDEAAGPGGSLPLAQSPEAFLLSLALKLPRAPPPSTVTPRCRLSDIHNKHEAGEYVGETAWRDFHADVQLLCDNAMDFNDDDTLWFVLGAMVQKEMQDVGSQIAEHWPEVLQA